MTEFHHPFDLIEEEEPSLHSVTPGPQHQVPNNSVHHHTTYFPTTQVPILSSVSLSLESGSRRGGGNSLHQTTPRHGSDINSISIPLQRHITSKIVEDKLTAPKWWAHIHEALISIHENNIFASLAL
ncbi:hypothetical protein L873DRAFT_1839888 [Choiromyces venosus 120613-1]|uniref:Uncharacterized protein n=1 Tax=Choiromyces venosus 120613-1 TaxID=1336337 RepID=A0A3N4K8V0_9PEZI|nr:hypothetical protein L873DRAFT_1839888 [Choiromyces venosus 120613-1]